MAPRAQPGSCAPRSAAAAALSVHPRRWFARFQRPGRRSSGAAATSRKRPTRPSPPSPSQCWCSGRSATSRSSRGCPRIGTACRRGCTRCVRPPTPARRQQPAPDARPTSLAPREHASTLKVLLCCVADPALPRHFAQQPLHQRRRRSAQRAGAGGRPEEDGAQVSTLAVRPLSNSTLLCNNTKKISWFAGGSSAVYAALHTAHRPPPASSYSTAP